MIGRYVIGTEWGEFHTDWYEGKIEVFTDKNFAQREADAKNEFGRIPGPDGTLIKANAWKVYELVEIIPVKEKEKGQ